MRHVLVTVAARAGNRWARRRVGEEPAQSQSAVGCDVSVRPVWQVIPYGGVSTDYCRQSHVAFATAGMCFVIDKSTAQYSEASPNTHTVR